MIGGGTEFSRVTPLAGSLSTPGIQVIITWPRASRLLLIAVGVSVVRCGAVHSGFTRQAGSHSSPSHWLHEVVARAGAGGVAVRSAFVPRAGAIAAAASCRLVARNDPAILARFAAVASRAPGATLSLVECRVSHDPIAILLCV